jgi:hypothetical protein
MHWIDPDCLPETKGNVKRFLVNPDGAIEGVILNGAAEAALVHLPPHLSAEIKAGRWRARRAAARNQHDRGHRTNRG